MPDILFVPGSLRAASSARATTRALVHLISDRASCTVADPGALPHYNADVTDDPDVDAFVAQVVSLNDAWLEKLYAYTSWLSRLLPSRDVPADITITDDMLNLSAF